MVSSIISNCLHDFRKNRSNGIGIRLFQVRVVSVFGNRKISAYFAKDRGDKRRIGSIIVCPVGLFLISSLKFWRNVLISMLCGSRGLVTSNERNSMPQIARKSRTERYCGPTKRGRKCHPRRRRRNVNEETSRNIDTIVRLNREYEWGSQPVVFTCLPKQIFWVRA